MNLDTLMSHIIHIISALRLLISCECCQGLCSKKKTNPHKTNKQTNKKHNRVEMCRIEHHLSGGTGMSHTCSFSCGKPPSCAMSLLPSATPQFKERCVTCLPLASKTHMPRGKSCCKPFSHVLDQHFVFGLRRIFVCLFCF